jgi:hypothetical protein
MKHSKIILSAVAFLVTAGSVLALRVHKKHQGVIYGKTARGSCTLSTCFTCPGPMCSAEVCHTVFSSTPIALKTNGAGKYWKATNPSNGHICTKPTHWTHVF